jgi:hypothetical protein
LHAVIQRVSEHPKKSSWWAWLKRPWAIVVAVATVIGVFFLNINSVLTNVRAFPSEVRETGAQLSTWYYDDDAWNGYWTSHPEAYVDVADMNLSKFPYGLYLQVQNGEIDGMIADQPVCLSVPFDFVLVRGHVDTFGKSATVFAWDTIGGHDVNFAKLKLKIVDGIMTVEPVEGVKRLFPTARIAFDPTAKEWPAEFCEGKQAAMSKMLVGIMKEQQAKLHASSRNAAPKRH